MEEELEKTKQSYQTQISAHEKKAHNNWVSHPNQRWSAGFDRSHPHAALKIQSLVLMWYLFCHHNSSISVPCVDVWCHWWCAGFPVGSSGSRQRAVWHQERKRSLKTEVSTNSRKTGQRAALFRFVINLKLNKPSTVQVRECLSVDFSCFLTEWRTRSLKLMRWTKIPLPWTTWRDHFLSEVLIPLASARLGSRN